MKIKKVRYRNIGSYGNRWNEIELTDSSNFYQVLGQNGGGKSTMLNCFTFALYGRLEKKKLKDLANRFNKHGEVEIEIVSKHGDDIRIERGVEPGYFRLYVNGVEIDKAGKRSVQEYLEEEFLEMPFHVFTNTLSLSINDFKSFIKMSNNDKKVIIDKLVGLQLLNKMRDLLKVQTKKLKEDADKQLASINAFDASYKRAKDEIENLSKKLNENNENRIIALTQYVEELKVEYKNQKEGQINLYKTIEDNQLQIAAINKEREGFASIIREFKNKEGLYSQGKCHVCESSFDTDFHNDILESYRDQAKLAQKDLIERNGILETLKESQIKLSESKDELLRLLNTIEHNHRTSKSELDNLNNNKGNDAQTESLENIAKDAQEKIEKYKGENTNTKKMLAFYGLVEEILGEKGVKQTAINSILPTLNHEIAKHTKTMGIEHKVVFDEEFNAKITHFGIEVSADTLSTGESKKVDFAVLLALIKLIKLLYPGINALFLDELFASLDANSQHHVIKILRTMCTEMNINIFIISHFPLVESDFDYIIKVNKEKGFSSIDIEKVL